MWTHLTCKMRWYSLIASSAVYEFLGRHSQSHRSVCSAQCCAISAQAIYDRWRERQRVSSTVQGENFETHLEEQQHDQVQEFAIDPRLAVDPCYESSRKSISVFDDNNSQPIVLSSATFYLSDYDLAVDWIKSIPNCSRRGHKENPLHLAGIWWWFTYISTDFNISQFIVDLLLKYLSGGMRERYIFDLSWLGNEWMLWVWRLVVFAHKLLMEWHFPGHLLWCTVTVTTNAFVWRLWRWKDPPDNNCSSSPHGRPRLKSVCQRRQAGFCHGWPTKLGKLDNSSEMKRKHASPLPCLTYSQGTLVVVIEYLQFLHIKWSSQLHYSFCLLSS